ncbi:MAG: SUMF1/EgtB/PvdO family nonheme iron enzyme [Planctomycetes bacterium]|nr:SUMF1/EgtB/PvdO family nonheme iron enzyme [Planctomycetota bacterium]
MNTPTPLQAVRAITGRHAAAVAVALAAGFSARPASAQLDPSGIEFVTVGAPGNPAYAGPDNGNFAIGRGSVDYEYRIGKTEVTTAQWMEFFNHFDSRVRWIDTPLFWGATATGNPNEPYRLLNSPTAGLRPVSGITWRTAAMFCNWLCNDKRTDIAAVMNGAYDVSTFGVVNGNHFTDQWEHNPGARYWIPTLDEWIKASYYDPNYGGTGVGGWWWNSINGTNVPLIPGPPGQGQTNAGFTLPNGGQYAIPLMSYPEVRTPWGLLDASGATAEWLESTYVVDSIPYRRIQGSHWGGVANDRIYAASAEFPGTPSIYYGFRIATAVPSSGPATLAMILAARLCARRNRTSSRPRESRRIGIGRVWRGAPLLALALTAAASRPASAQLDPSGIDFVTVGAPGNPGYSGPDVNNTVTGRGSVPYEYRIGKTEVTTAQWMEFYNAFYGRAPFVNAPVRWGAIDRGAGQSPRFVLANAPNAELFPVSGPTWRTCAMFCNWLHNDKRTDLDAVMNGAYDVSTFGYQGNTDIFTDQQAHNPGAKYWIPTLDEWIKGAFYDPNYGGQNVGGWWWNTPAATNVPLIHGPPGVGQSNSAFSLPNGDEYRIPLMSYPDVRSPWGMLDAAGATSEFTETVLNVDGILYRATVGSHWTNTDPGLEAIYAVGGEFPSLPDLFLGVRIAAAIPAPGSSLGVVLAGCWLARRRR